MIFERVFLYGDNRTRHRTSIWEISSSPCGKARSQKLRRTGQASEGVPPVEAAIRTGFSDQSHFTNYFNQFIGLAPGTYREIFSEKDGDGGQHGE